jgi:crotonobetainyl-CoA:carnitine CoA-transferase CaiB-like acyl-CoA transferase
MDSLQAAGIAAGVVHNSRDVWEDPQLQHRNFWWEAEAPELKGFGFGAPPALLAGTPRRFRRPRPRLGEHNEYVFSELLGLTDEEIGRHMSEGTIE